MALRTDCSASSGCTITAGGGRRPMRCRAASTSASNAWRPSSDLRIAALVFVERLQSRLGLRQCAARPCARARRYRSIAHSICAGRRLTASISPRSLASASSAFLRSACSASYSWSRCLTARPASCRRARRGDFAQRRAASRRGQNALPPAMCEGLRNSFRPNYPPPVAGHYVLPRSAGFKANPEKLYSAPFIFVIVREGGRSSNRPTFAVTGSPACARHDGLLLYPR